MLDLHATLSGAAQYARALFLSIPSSVFVAARRGWRACNGAVTISDGVVYVWK